MNIFRLERLVKLLEQDAANPEGVKFDLTAWARGPNGARFGFLGDLKPTLDYGTAACAFGLAAISGEFKDEGLGYEIASDGALSPTYGEYVEFEAAEKFFEISNYLAFKLFDPSYYPYDKRKGAEAELEVVRRLKHLIANRNTNWG